jgi:CO/xanthine dehydrogenase Mo-binding subunit
MNSKNKAFRNDAYAKVTGRTKYTGDIKFPNMLHCVPVYSNYVSAKIISVETAEAEKAVGVVRVITAKDVPGTNVFGQIIKDYRIFVDDRIYYNGDVIAVVVADTRENAIEAGKLVKVTVEENKPILDVEEALTDRQLVHPEFGTNIVNHHKVRRGDVEKGFEESELILDERFTTGYIEHSYMEPEAAVCRLRDDGVMEIYGSMQHPFSTRRFVAALLGKPLSEIEIIGTPMGGGFGGKDDTAAVVCARTALAAMLTGKTVKCYYNREWSIRESYKRHPYIVYYKMGLSSDGKIKAAKVKIVADSGAYCSVTPWVTWRSTVQCCGPYEVENVHCDTFGVYTNKVVTGAMRGFGSPQMNFVIESMIDMAAEKLNMDKIEIRQLNMVKQGSITITGQKLDNHKVAMGEVLDAALKESDYFEKIKRCTEGKGDDEELYGIGLAMSYRGMSLGGEGVDFCAAMINVQADGSVIIETGVHENGQGAESAMCLITARELGIDLRRIRYRRASTSVIPDSGTTVASRGTVMGGGALTEAAKILKGKFFRVASEKFSIPESDFKIENDYLVSVDGKKLLRFDELAKLMFSSREFPHAFGVFKAPVVTWDEETGQGNAYFSWTYGCQVVELNVNRKSGKIKLLKAYAAHDCGKVANVDMTLGQFYGGMAMGIGYGMFEDFAMKDGKITSTNFNTYRLPRANDVPEMKAILIENPDPNSPSGAKGIGEPTNELMAPAIANAVYNATGIRFNKIPIKIKADELIRLNKKLNLIHDEIKS